MTCMASSAFKLNTEDRIKPGSPLIQTLAGSMTTHANTAAHVAFTASMQLVRTYTHHYVFPCREYIRMSDVNSFCDLYSASCAGVTAYLLRHQGSLHHQQQPAVPAALSSQKPPGSCGDPADPELPLRASHLAPHGPHLPRMLELHPLCH